jgi:hypothetical protein
MQHAAAISDSVDSFVEVSSGKFCVSIELTKQFCIWFGITQSQLLWNDSVSIDNGSSFTINVLGNDDAKGSPIVTIGDDKWSSGNVDNTITYTHNGSNLADSVISYNGVSLVQLL